MNDHYQMGCHALLCTLCTGADEVVYNWASLTEHYNTHTHHGEIVDSLTEGLAQAATVNFDVQQALLSRFQNEAVDYGEMQNMLLMNYITDEFNQFMRGTGPGLIPLLNIPVATLMASVPEIVDLTI